jgi:pimeloyl-ACP methyl ester carboxylesterase
MPLAMYLSMGQEHDYRAGLARVTSPVLVLHGDRDILPQTDGREMASYFNHSRFVSIAGAGHFLYDEKASDVAKAVEEFLGR